MYIQAAKITNLGGGPIILRFVSRHLPWIVGAAIGLLVALVYLTTLQTDVNGLDDLVDAGEFQNALYLWGIVHPTGYPLYLLVGGVFVHLLNALGLNPAAGASLFSLVGAVSALALFFTSIHIQTRHIELAAAATLCLAALGAFWFRSNDAEVYSWSFFFVALALYLALTFRAHPTPTRLLCLLFAIGTGTAHHRLVGLVLPAILLWIAPEAWGMLRAKRRLAIWSVAALLLPFAIYIYLPLRAHFGTKWEFLQADTWNGFWNLFTGRGYLQEAVTVPTDAASLVSGATSVLRLLAAQLTPVGLGSAAVAVTALWWRAKARLLAAFLTLGVATYIVFAIIYPIRDIDAYLVPALMLLVWAVPAGVSEILGRRPIAVVLVSLLTLGLAVFVGWQSYAVAFQVGQDRSGRELLNAVDSLTGPRTVLVGPWGPDFFGFWYGKYVTGEIAAGTKIVTPDQLNRGDLKQGTHVYASRDIFHSVALEEWDEKLGHTFVQSAGDKIVELSNRRMANPALESVRGEATLGAVVTLAQTKTSFDPKQNTLALALYWRAEKKIKENYSVMVHLVDPAQNDRIIMQADSANPVYGFYPTSRWQKGEIVRDDYELKLPRGVSLDRLNLVVGWYRADPSGSGFQNLGTYRMNAPIAKVAK